MSIHSDSGSPNNDSATQGTTSSPKPTVLEETASSASQSTPNPEGGQETSTNSLLASLLSPFGSLLSSSAPKSSQNHESPDEATESATKEEVLSKVPQKVASPSKNSTCKPDKSESAVNDKETPEPYYAPAQVPAFKALQKKRLSGTRTKQLLRAAGRAHDDPPPPPELGTCCGSSCDPCVNDLWREELSVWKERWGDRGVEGAGKRKELEW